MLTKIKKYILNWLVLPALDLKVKLDSIAYCPKRNSEHAVGYDLYSPTPVTLKAKKLTTIPLLFSTSFNPGWEAGLSDKSSFGAKGIGVLGGVIDPDYRGGWCVMLYNNGVEDVKIGNGDKIAQVVFRRVSNELPQVVTDLPPSKRGQGGFGSTGK